MSKERKQTLPKNLFFFNMISKILGLSLGTFWPFYDQDLDFGLEFSDEFDSVYFRV
jgi:hypothetical protein